MACPDADDLEDAVLAAATKPKRVRTETTEVEAHSLRDVIAAAEYARAVCAADRRVGPRHRKIAPGSAD